MHDELYWNVTGNRWKFPIEQAVSTVHFPDGAGVEGVKTYTGSYGQRGHAADSVVSDDGTRVVTHTSAPLQPGGRDDAVAFRKGVVSKPTTMIIDLVCM